MWDVFHDKEHWFRQSPTSYHADNVLVFSESFHHLDLVEKQLLVFLSANVCE